jgi:hypothetical protein
MAKTLALKVVRSALPLIFFAIEPVTSYKRQSWQSVIMHIGAV